MPYFGCVAFRGGMSEGVHDLLVGSARIGGGFSRILVATALSLTVAACTSGGVPPLEVALASVESPTESATDDNAFSSGQTVLVESAVTSSSESADASGPQISTGKDVSEDAAIKTADNAASDIDNKPAETAVTGGEVETETSAQAQLVAAAKPEPEKKRRFLSNLWSTNAADRPIERLDGRQLERSTTTPVVNRKQTGRVVRASTSGGDILPGVRESNNLFEISRKSGIEDNSDVDINEFDGGVRVASAAGLARLAPNGLLKQREGVDVACLKPSLVRMLKKVERHYGKRVVVTSGYRSPSNNRRARGARNSLHMYCAAADIQVDGVTKWELARYLRSMPGRGGVGTYCHTKSVHVDVGPERDWNWRCRRSKKRRG